MKGNLTGPENLHYFARMLGYSNKDTKAIGKILAVLIFGLASAAIIIIVGVLPGGRFNITSMGLLKSLGFLFLRTLASAGVGLIVGSFSQ